MPSARQTQSQCGPPLTVPMSASPSMWVRIGHSGDVDRQGGAVVGVVTPDYCGRVCSSARRTSRVKHHRRAAAPPTATRVSRASSHLATRESRRAVVVRLTPVQRRGRRQRRSAGRSPRMTVDCGCLGTESVTEALPLKCVRASTGGGEGSLTSDRRAIVHTAAILYTEGSRFESPRRLHCDR